MSAKRLGGDAEAKRDLKFECATCCPRCHDDLDQGESDEMLLIETPEGVYDVCCDVWHAWEDSTKTTKAETTT